MDDDECRAHKQELANLGRAFREARERIGLRRSFKMKGCGVRS